MSKGEWKPKYATEPKFHTFKTTKGEHAMIGIPHKVNDVTGYGLVFSMGVAKAKALISPQNLMALRKFVGDNPEEASRQITEEDHEGKEWD